MAAKITLSKECVKVIKKAQRRAALSVKGYVDNKYKS